jgi:hypothetical protein
VSKPKPSRQQVLRRIYDAMDNLDFGSDLYGDGEQLYVNMDGHCFRIVALPHEHHGEERDG